VAATPAPPPRALRVLVVDDLKDAADSLAELLTLSGYAARATYCGCAAVAAADAFDPDVVVLDVEMPGEDGYAVAARLRERRPRRPVLVAVTGCPHLDDRSRAEGIDHHFLKPADPAALLALLGRCAATPAT
jgi:CheY-like chemotaxis protein